MPAPIGRNNGPAATTPTSTAPASPPAPQPDAANPAWTPATRPGARHALSVGDPVAIVSGLKDARLRH